LNNGRFHGSDRFASATVPGPSQPGLRREIRDSSNGFYSREFPGFCENL
jgi:hypothetical protein